MILGLDTSCYTTSLAVLDDQGRLFADERRMLAVPEGHRGLRQSEAVFMHLRRLPELLEKAGRLSLSCVCASTRPRPVEGSYMPVFTVGESFGRALAAAGGVPFLALSHQEGHILAGLWSAGALGWENFLAVHMSGGTTEVLSVTRDRGKAGLTVTELGGSEDLHAGQFIDRVGVALGLPFPAGPHLEKLAGECGKEMLEVPVSVKGLRASFSGPESHVRRAVEAGRHSPAAIARGVENAVARTLVKLVNNALHVKKSRHVLFVGGVAANSYIKEMLTDRVLAEVRFAAPQYAGDNAVGCALFGAIAKS